MARYIDLEELVKRIDKYIQPEAHEDKDLIEWCKDECIRQGYAMPTANVALKSEVAREIFEEIEDNYADFLFDGYRNIIVLTEKDYNELKKKYTEE